MNLNLKRLYHVCNPERACLDGNLPSLQWRIRSIDIRARQGAALLANDRAAGLIEFASLNIPADLNEVDELTRSSAAISWVAVVTNAHLNDPEIGRIVRTRCVSYIRLPAAAETIVQELDRAYEMSAADASEHRNANSGAPAMIGACAAMGDVRAAIRTASEHERPVTIVGESGSGKALAAASIHLGSLRREGPFVSIDCAAYAPERVEAEIFGVGETKVETGNQRSRLNMAEGGSLYIDGICELPLAAQERLADLLGGGARNVRIICSTHIDLQRAADEHRLHARLFASLSPTTIAIPPLRERGPDIRLLAAHLLKSFRSDSRHDVQGFSVCAWEAFDAHTWPGNVREMINRIRHAIVANNGPLITATDLGFEHAASMPMMRASGDGSDDIPEWDAIELAVARNQGRLDAAAMELHISKVLLARMLASNARRAVATPGALRMDSA
ncbi:sigma-54-dependent Fis family transcriptional regulator [Paraburkholderia sp. Tr-20389]|uniref:sigma-54-dependent transcriptional regulator n=1 Tax=Paraburkholderia sp. Tr-20389 TaxID=2703903 RepID=UPI00197F1DEE|nr:sigma 54-interacting transcriptional regulator [Paraburkholderia sp. Tr-20389]MBN3756866.1 sigma-54-dependent Fis family transcriptional regulator [Paraburkholderia sp. Tr-20389]